MQLVRMLAAVVVLGAGGAFATPSSAGICTLVADPLDGTLVLSGDGHHLDSQLTGGRSSLLVIASVGASTLTVQAPSLTQWPSGYNPSGLSYEVAFRGVVGLGAINQPYTSGPAVQAIPNIVGTATLGIDNRINTATGFAAGTYRTRTVVTCS